MADESKPSEPVPGPGAVTRHYYVSTYCLHELHGDCRMFCKQCGAACLCPCHDQWH